MPFTPLPAPRSLAPRARCPDDAAARERHDRAIGEGENNAAPRPRAVPPGARTPPPPLPHDAPASGEHTSRRRPKGNPRPTTPQFAPKLPKQANGLTTWPTLARTFSKRINVNDYDISAAGITSARQRIRIAAPCRDGLTAAAWHAAGDKAAHIVARLYDLLAAGKKPPRLLNNLVLCTPTAAQASDAGGIYRYANATRPSG